MLAASPSRLHPCVQTGTQSECQQTRRSGCPFSTRYKPVGGNYILRDIFEDAVECKQSNMRGSSNRLGRRDTE